MKALILVGGEGKRLWPKTEMIPKPMVQILNKPIVYYQIEWLKKYGLEEIIFLTGYKNYSFKEYFGNVDLDGLKIKYSHEDSPLGRGGAIKNAINKFNLHRENLVITNGDVLTDLSLDKMMKFHFENSVLVTLMSVPYRSQSGIVKVDENDNVIEFSEKTKLPFWINGGIYISGPDFFNYLPEKGDHEVETFPKLAKLNQLKAFRTTQNWISIDTMKDLDDCEEFIKTYF
ncbi:MAG: nucleotidyltransferase [Chloroflexi bacterium]|nr:nucleotidyltransferase [Chloroflexota bacterium]|tara:strand:+ start:451 stop:1140 length:690 start_codon:yes stop_codon:yes gene_type:complete